MSTTLHPNSTRLAFSTLAAGITTLLLFYLMMLLIVSDEVTIEPTSLTFIEFVRVPEVRKVESTRKPPNKPNPPEEVPPTPTPNFVIGQDGIPTGPIKIINPPTTIQTGDGTGDGMYLPLVKVQPNYPRRALSKGIEGYTIVEFDVGADGSVRNPRVIEYAPSTIFNKASLNAVMKFRYKPMVENGTPVEVIGVQNRFTFELTQSG